MKNILVSRREIHMAMVSSSTKENRLVKYMARALGTSRKKFAQTSEISVANRCK